MPLAADRRIMPYQNLLDILVGRARTILGADLTFDPVPKQCYIDSICSDVEHAAADILEQPVYITLNLCRVLAYLKDGLCLSKKEGGEWGLAHLAPLPRSLKRLRRRRQSVFEREMQRKCSGFYL